MSDELAEAAVDAISAIGGVHPGSRAAHAKGTLLAGTFTATPEAARLTTAAHMQGEPVKATVRFSNGSGNPSGPDHGRDGRGMAVKFYLPDGVRTDIVALTLPSFFVRTPEDFVEFTGLRKPDPETGQPDMEKLGAYLGEHPEAVPAIQASLSALPIASYGQCRYNSIHSFRWTAPDGTQRYVRYSFVPEAGDATIEVAEAKALGENYLQDEIVERAERGPVAFRLDVQVAAGEDPVDDPTAALPEDREWITVGGLELTGADTERERDGDVMVMDPTRVCEGIECSDDPILHFRRRAYAVSVERRSGLVLAP